MLRVAFPYNSAGHPLYIYSRRSPGKSKLSGSFGAHKNYKFTNKKEKNKHGNYYFCGKRA